MKNQFLEKVKQGIISMADMSEHLGISERSVRKIAESIKKENLQNAKAGWLLISGNFGYKLTTNVNEISEYVNRIYSQSMSLLMQVNCAKKFLSHTESEQLGVLFPDSKD